MRIAHYSPILSYLDIIFNRFNSLIVKVYESLVNSGCHIGGIVTPLMSIDVAELSAIWSFPADRIKVHQGTVKGFLVRIDL